MHVLCTIKAPVLYLIVAQSAQAQRNEREHEKELEHLSDGQHAAREAGGDEQPGEAERREQQPVDATHVVHPCALLQHAASERQR